MYLHVRFLVKERMHFADSEGAISAINGRTGSVSWHSTSFLLSILYSQSNNVSPYIYITSIDISFTFQTSLRGRNKHHRQLGEGMAVPEAKERGLKGGVPFAKSSGVIKRTFKTSAIAILSSPHISIVGHCFHSTHV